MASTPPIIEILQYFTTKPRIPSDESSYSEFLNKCKIPYFDKNKIKPISEALTSNTPVYTAIKPLRDLFFFSSYEIETVQQFTNINESMKKNIITVVFANSIAFLFQEYSDFYISHLNNVLKALIFITTQINKRNTCFLYTTILNRAVTISREPFSVQMISMICSHADSYMLDMPSAFASLGKILRITADEDAKSFLYTIIQKLLTNFNKENIDYDDTDVCIGIKKTVKLLHPDSLIILSLMAKNRQSSNVSALYSFLPKSCSLIHSDFDESIKLFCEPLDFKYYRWKDKYETENTSIKDNLNSEFPISNIDKQQTTGSYLSPMYRKQLKSVIPILDNIHFSHINSFFGAYAELLKKKENLKDYLALMYFLTHIKFYHDIEESVFQALILDELFEPTVTLFNCDQNFQATSFYRERFIMITMVHGPNFFPKLFNRFINYPFLFAEIVIRVLNHLPNVYPTSFGLPKVLDSLLTVQKRLQCISFQMKESERKISVNARSAVFTLIFNIFLNPLPSNLKLKSFLPSLLDQSFSDSLFQRLNKGLRISNCIFLKNAFNILKYSNPPSSIVEILMNYTSQAILHEPETTSTVILSLFDFLEVNSNKSLLSLTLDLVILMFTKQHHYNFVKTVYSKMSEIIPKTKLKCWDQLFQMLSMTTDSKIGSFFIITNPNMLITVFSVFMNYKEYDLLHDEMIRLCDYSSYNRIQLYEGEIDLLLLEMIYNFPKDFNFRSSFIRNIKTEDKLFKFTIPLFLRAIATKSSEVVAERMIKIIAPRDDLRFSPISIKFLDNVIPLSDKLTELSNISFPIGLNPHIFEVGDIPFSEFSKSSSITFWIYIDEFLSSKISIRSTIFTIELCKSTFLEVYITNNCLYCTFMKDNFQKKLLMAQGLPTNQWCLVLLRFRLTYKAVEMTTQTNNKTNFSTVSIPIKHKKNEFVKFKVGNSTKFHGNQGLLTCIYQLDSFYFFGIRLTELEYSELQQNRSTFTLKHDPLFSYPPIPNKENKYSLHVIFDKKSFSSLNNIFRFFYPIEKFIQIFNYFNLCTSEYSIILLRSLKGLFGPSIIKSFSSLPYFLVQTKQPILYDHYLEIFDFLNVCSNEKDQNLLLSNLLLNFEIWIRAEPLELKKIIQHINTVLYETCPGYFRNEAFFSKSLGYIRLFFSNENLTIDLLSYHNSKLDHLNFSEYAHYFVDLLIRRSINNPSEIDTLIASILCCSDQELVECFLKIYLKVASNKANHHHLTQLISFDIENNRHLFPLFIECVMASSNNFYHSLILIGYQIKGPFWYENFLCDARKFPETFVFVIIVGLQSSEENQMAIADLLLELATNESTKFMIKQCQFWMIWPLIFALQVPNEVKTKASKFISKISFSPFDQNVFDTVLIFLKILQSTTTLDVVPIQIFFLKKLSKNLSSKLDSEEIDLLLKRFFLTMYLQFNFNPFSNELIELYENSYFSQGGDHPYKVNPKISKIYSMRDLLYALHINDKHIFYYNIAIEPPNPILNKMLMPLVSHAKKSSKYHKLFHLLDAYFKEKDTRPTLGLVIKILQKFETEISHLLETLKELTAMKRIELAKFFRNFKFSMKEIAAMQIEDPFNSFKSERIKNSEIFQQNGINIIRNFPPVFDISKDSSSSPKWKRKFIFSTEFNSIMLQKQRKLMFENKKIPISKPTDAIKSFPCKRITINSVKESMLYIYKNKIVIDIIGKRKIIIKASSLRYILTRNRIQKPTAIEFFTTEGLSFLLDFAPLSSTQVLNVFRTIRMKNLIEREDSNFAKFISQSGLVKKWINNEMTNFEFLLRLNMYTGRSYMDAQNGVIFPWVSIFGPDHKRRDFNKPITAQDSSRLAHFMQVFDMNGYIFGTAPSNSMLLAYYFVRLEPYTKLHLSIHDGHFDVLERMFRSVSAFFTTLLNGDEWKEATPEFFCFPEIFMDLNSNDIGDLNTNFESIFDFVYNNRKTLESDYVSLHLSEWVSMLWGNDQDKIFMPYLYKEAWQNEECDKSIIPSMLQNLGSVPPKVFDSQIPKRIPINSSCQFKKMICIKIPKVRMSRKAFIFEKNGLARLIICFDDGNIQRFSINIDKKAVEPVYLAPLKLKIPSDAKYVMARETVFVFDEKTERVHCVNFEQLKTVNTKMMSFDFAQGGTNFGEIITSTKSGTVKFWRFPYFVPTNLFSISVESISAVSVCQPYGTFICATNDGYIRTFSIEKRRLINEVNLGFIAEKIISTDGWGFILLYSPGYLHLFTINGFLIKKQSINFEVYQWSTFKDQYGFDYICCADPIGHIYVFEAYYLNKIEQIAACHERIISVQYLYRIRAIVAHASSSTVYFIPYK